MVADAYRAKFRFRGNASLSCVWCVNGNGIVRYHDLSAVRVSAGQQLSWDGSVQKVEPRFIGQTRYSLFIPNSAAWRASMESDEKDEAEYRNYLYSPERLDFRERSFTTLTVPAIADAAEHFDVHHVVSYSESLPDKYKDSLRETAAKYPFLVLQELADGTGDWGPSERLISQLIEPGVFGRYRLDDDDVLSKHYFELMANYVKNEFTGMAVSLPLGIEAIYHQDHFYNFREVHVPMNSMGLLYVSKLENDGAIHGPRAGAHDKTDRLAPVIMDASKLGYLRINHTGQDNLLRHQSERVQDQLLTNMGKYPAVNNLSAISDSFPAVADKVLHTQDSFETIWSAPVDDGVKLLIDGDTSGITVTIKGAAPAGLRKHPLALSLSLESASGRDLGPRKQLAGIATSLDGAIGQFAYFDVSEGDFVATVSVFVPGETRIRLARIIPLVRGARDIRIDSIAIDHQGAGVAVDALDQVARQLVSGGHRIRDTAGRVAARVKPALMPWMTRALGPERTNSVVNSVAAKLKRR
ncbi:glycosyltransferase [Corynebacterium glaucum]|nr:glycosyltransferase [Corynebacterium glaucum]